MGRLSQENKSILNFAYLYMINTRDKWSFYTNYDRDLTINGVPSVYDGGGTVIYTAGSIGHDEFLEAKHLEGRVLEGRMGISNVDLRDLIINSSERAAVCVVRKVYFDDYLTADWETDTYNVFRGDMSEVGQSGATYTFKIAPFKEAVQFPKYRIGTPCAHTLYGSRCGVNVNDWKKEVVITQVNRGRRFIRFPLDEPQDYLNNGYVAVEGHNLGILSAVKYGDDMGLELRTFPVGSNDEELLKVGTVITLYPGCNKAAGLGEDTGHCKNKFDNLANFGGFPYIPRGNPSDGGPSYLPRK